MKKIKPNRKPQKAPSQAAAQVRSPAWRVLGFFLPTGQVTVATSTSSSSFCFCRPSAISSPLSAPSRSEEHTSELQSHLNLVCRLLLEKKKNIKDKQNIN